MIKLSCDNLSGRLSFNRDLLYQDSCFPDYCMIMNSGKNYLFMKHKLHKIRKHYIMGVFNESEVPDNPIVLKSGGWQLSRLAP